MKINLFKSVNVMANFHDVLFQNNLVLMDKFNCIIMYWLFNRIKTKDNVNKKSRNI